MPHFYDPKDQSGRSPAPGVTLRPIWLERLMMVRVEIDPRAEVPLHTHPHEQGGIVLEGEADMTIGGETRTVRAGDGYLIPGGVEHAVVGNDAPSVFLDVFSPPREEYK